MQLNQGWFLCNGHCGYVLQPDYFKQTSYSPFDKHTLINVDPLTISVTVSQIKWLVYLDILILASDAFSSIYQSTELIKELRRNLGGGRLFHRCAEVSCIY